MRSRCGGARVRAGRIARSALLSLLAACADFDPPAPVVLPDEVVADPSLARDVQPIFTARCATAGCHNVATHQGDLVLTPERTYEETVNVPAQLVTTMPLVRPSDADSSWLVRMIEADPERRLHNVRMPLGRPALTPNQIQTIVNWVERGAPRN
jgi:hypothetical protein